MRRYLRKLSPPITLEKRLHNVSTGANKFTILSLADLSVSLSSSESQENVRTSCSRGMSSGLRNGLETSAYISVAEIESCEREKREGGTESKA